MFALRPAVPFAVQLKASRISKPRELDRQSRPLATFSNCTRRLFGFALIAVWISFFFFCRARTSVGKVGSMLQAEVVATQRLPTRRGKSVKGVPRIPAGASRRWVHPTAECSL